MAVALVRRLTPQPIEQVVAALAASRVGVTASAITPSSRMRVLPMSASGPKRTCRPQPKMSSDVAISGTLVFPGSLLNVGNGVRQIICWRFDAVGAGYDADETD